MKITHLIAAATLAASSFGLSAAAAQPYPGHGYHHPSRGYGNGGRHRRGRICRTVWRGHHRVTRCR